MNVLTYGAGVDRNGAFPKFDEVSGLFGFETAAPIFAPASVKFDQSKVQYLGKRFPYTPVTNSWQALHFKVSAISACGLVQWLTGSTSRGDLRFNGTTRKLEARVNGTLVKTSAKIFNAATRYHLQLFVTINGSYQWIQVKIDDKPLLVLDYFLNSGASPANYDRFRWGPFLGGGSGVLLFDNLVLNDALPDTGGDYSWPGQLVITGAAPIADGVNIVDEWGATGAPTVPTATDELDEDDDITFAHTETNRRRHSVRFESPSQPIGGGLEAVGFDVVTRVTSLPTGSEDNAAKVKLRFRQTLAPRVGDEIQTIRITGGESGDTIQFSYEGILSAELDFDASLADVQAEADAIFGEAGVVVTGTPGAAYIFSFAAHWSKTRMLAMEVFGVFGGSGPGSIAIERTQLGDEIFEAGEPAVYLPLELSDDAITDPFPEALSTVYESRTARRRVALDGGAWTKTKADAVELVLRSDVPFSLRGDETLPPTAEDEEGTAVVNASGVDAFGINAGTGEEGQAPPIVEPPVEPPEVGPTVAYASLSGSDATGTGTILNPWRTWRHGIQVGGWSTLYARGGAYGERVRSDLFAFPIGTSFAAAPTIAGYPGEPVSIKNLSLTASYLKYIIFKDFTIDGQTTENECLYMSDGPHHCRFENLKFTRARQQGTLIAHYTETNHEFLSCEWFNNGFWFTDASHPNGSFWHGCYNSGRDNLFDHCLFHDNSGYGYHGYNGYANPDRASGNMLRYCQAYRNGITLPPGIGVAGFFIGSGDSNLLHSSIARDNRGSGVQVAYKSGIGNIVAFVTIFRNTGAGLQLVGVNNSIVRNVISYGNGSNYNDLGSGTIQDHNLFGTNPLFVSEASTPNLHLQALSPAIDAGVAVSGLTIDFDGITRANPPEIGAYEKV